MHPQNAEYNKDLFPKGRWLMCSPSYFDVKYEINPWMSKEITPATKIAIKQWQELHHTILRLGGWVEYVEPREEQPDIVFTANAGLAKNNSVVISRFRFPERQGEAKWYREWFDTNGFKSFEISTNKAFEGEGDALFAGETLFCGYGFRSDLAAYEEVCKILNVKNFVHCQLKDPRFYHLDTCFAPINESQAILFKGAFTEESLRQMEKNIELIEVAEEDAVKFACNAVVLEKEIILPAGCASTTEKLVKLGYKVYPVALNEFMKSGGAAKCLSLKIDR